jgi:two-component system response regulator VicR
MESSQYTILVVDDEELIRDLVVTFLSKLGHSCVTAIDGVEALEKIGGNKIDVVITDVMVMTAFDEEYSAGIAISVGAREFIKKPFSLDEFAIRLHKMINDSKVIKGMKSEKNVDENIEDLMDELEKTLKKS